MLCWNTVIGAASAGRPRTVTGVRSASPTNPPWPVLVENTPIIGPPYGSARSASPQNDASVAGAVGRVDVGALAPLRPLDPHPANAAIATSAVHVRARMPVILAWPGG